MRILSTGSLFYWIVSHFFKLVNSIVQFILAK